MVAAGCLVQWYEVDMFEEYLDSLTKSIVTKEKVLIDMCLVTNQDLEKVSDEVDMLTYIMEKYVRVCNQYKLQGYQIKYEVRDDLYTIADYRRDFKDRKSVV